jgi:type II secretory pathway pseudopilin PulG
MSGRTPFAFSLVEVVIATGIFASALAVVLLLLPSLTKQSGEAADALTAQQFGDILRIELGRVATSEGFDTLAGSLPELATPLANGRQFIATRDGMRLHSTELAPTFGEAIGDAEQYFLIECWKFPTEPLRPDGSKAFLATFVRVSWPYRTGVPGGAATTTPFGDRSQFTFTCAINR